MERSYSEGDIFMHSWDYLNVFDKTTGLNGAEAALSMLQYLPSPQTGNSEHKERPKPKRSRTKKKLPKKSSITQDEKEQEEIQIITPRKKSEETNEIDDAIVYKINAEGRKIIEKATLDQLVRAFAGESQGMQILLKLVIQN